MGGITEQVKQMIMDMSIAVAFSILLVLLITSGVFKGWRAPLAVLLSIPLALSGVVLALILFWWRMELSCANRCLDAYRYCRHERYCID